MSATVQFAQPNRTQPPPMVNASADEGPQRTHVGHRILLVEDNPGDAFLVQRCLAKQHLAADHATDLASAIELLAENGPYEVILLDLRLPDTADLETVRAVRRVAPATAIVALTGIDDDQLAYDCISNGAQDYVRKQDITAPLLRRAIEHALARTRAAEFRERLDIAERRATIGQLAASVAHEVNNHAMVLVANATLTKLRLDELRDHVMPSGQPLLDDLSADIGATEMGLHRVSKILRELQSFARTDDLGEDGGTTPIDAASAAQDAIAFLGNRLRQRAIVSFDHESCPPVEADERKLTQVLVNLLANADDAFGERAREKNRISVRVKPVADRHVAISVADNGAGIEADALERIFEPFYTTKNAGQGSGLGLAICADIVRSLGGRLEVRSTPGKGTVFTVWLPASDADLPQTTDEPSAASLRRPLRVLLIDDEASVRSAIRRILEHQGCRVVEADGGLAALAFLADDDQFDAVLCDLMMPDVDGVTVCDALAIEHPEIFKRTAVLSGGAFTPQASEFLREGSLPVLGKPCELDALIAVLNQLADQD